MTIKLYEKYPNFFETSFVLELEQHLNLSEILIPFSEFFAKTEKKDIYSGEERIPFESRDPEYKSILLTEFIK